MQKGFSISKYYISKRVSEKHKTHTSSCAHTSVNANIEYIKLLNSVELFFKHIHVCSAWATLHTEKMLFGRRWYQSLHLQANYGQAQEHVQLSRDTHCGCVRGACDGIMVVLTAIIWLPLEENTNLQAKKEDMDRHICSDTDCGFPALQTF